MNTTSNTDYAALLKDTFTLATKGENLVPLLVDAVIVMVLGTCTMGICMPTLMFGYTRMAHRVVQGEKIAVGDSFQGFQHFVPSLLLGVILAVGFMLGSVVIVGGFALLFACTYSLNAMVATPGLGPVDAISKSWPLVRDHLVDTLVLWAILVGGSALLSPTFIGSVAAFAFSTVLGAVLFARITNPSGISVAPQGYLGANTSHT